MQRSSHTAAALQKKYKSSLFAVWGLVLAFLLVAPLFIGKYYVGFVTLLFLYCILAIGYNIASGFCGVTTFATGALYGCGAYVSGILITTYDVPFLAAALIATLAAGLLSFVISLSAYKVSGTYLALVSYGLLEVVTRVIVEVHEVTGGSSGFHIDKWVVFGHAISRNEKYYIILAVMLLCFLLQYNIRKSQWGRDFLTLKSDRIAASMLGINVPKVRTIGFLISALIAGLAGALYGSYAGFIAPESFNFNVSLIVLLMVITGGSGTLSGPVLGAAIIHFLPQLFNDNADLKQMIYGIMLIVLLQALPRGIVGNIKRKFAELEFNLTNDKIDESVEIDFSKYGNNDPDGPEDILVVEGLTKQYGGLTAVGDLSFTVKKGSIHALIGPNGAGKTTTVNNMTGIEMPTSGKVYLNGNLITGKKSHEIAHLGISRTYQHVRLINSLSVLDNVVVATRLARGYGLGTAIFHGKKLREVDEANYIEAQECLNLIGLGDKANEMPQNLSAGQQKLLEICRALVVKPKLLILDEPCAGLTESETEQFSIVMKKIKETGISILFIEHHMSIVMGVSDMITVIDHGVKIAEGVPSEIANDPIVRKAYLGERSV